MNTRRLLAHDSGEVGRLRQQLTAYTATQVFRGRRAALVLTFGCDPDAGVGSRLSHAVNAQLKASNPELFSAAVPRDFINMASSGKARLEIYLFAR